jgi:hypothetical protein
MIKLSEIEKFIREAGSDDLGVFGGDKASGAYIQQVPEEFASFILTLLQIEDEAERPIQNYLEIGVAAGGTAFVLNHYFQFDNIVFVDDNKHPKAQFRPSVMAGIDYREFIGRSEESGIINKVSETGLYFDLIFIDGDHLYNAVRQDVINYLPFLREGGYLALHDSVLTAWGVPRLVAELKEDPGMVFVGEFAATSPPMCGVALFVKSEPKFVWDLPEGMDEHITNDENTPGEEVVPECREYTDED